MEPVISSVPHQTVSWAEHLIALKTDTVVFPSVDDPGTECSSLNVFTKSIIKLPLLGPVLIKHYFIIYLHRQGIKVQD